MKYQQLNRSDISNGPGIRVSLFVSGCTLRCKGCHNAAAWDFSRGIEYTKETEEYILDVLARPYITGLSLLGGEPYDSPDPEALLSLVRKMKMHHPEKDIWI